MLRPNIILVVDDSATVRALLTAVLSAVGHDVVAVDGVRAGLRKLRTLRPALILTDYAMPKLDGHAFVRLVRRDPRLSGVPVIVVSSQTADEKRHNMSQAGADGWLAKPVDLTALLETVERELARTAPRPRRRLPVDRGIRWRPPLTSLAHRLTLYVFLLTGLFTKNGGSVVILEQL
ncbi:response regulator [Brevundimonas sp.]|uniref:response regulator n=1 Tax=Brevundimonas sp. TaxID=1871086 RepID=UPI002730CC08|nr:response regulator [Brevundimonas sp.]MDP1912905.1 response regulator [Brevundimonas sp.]